MATLNLIPNPFVLTAQVGVFLANLVVVKKLLVEPYLTVRDRRDALTLGSKDEATKALAEVEAAAQRIEARLSAALLDGKRERDRSRDQAQAKRDQILTGATAEAKQQIAAVEQEIRRDVAQEKLKIPEIVRTLTEEVYKLALA